MSALIVDVVELGPERAVSGRCRICGDYVLARLDNDEASSGGEFGLEDSYQRHLAGWPEAHG
jgi:hypothetical protein